ncbi:hypothetical protein B0H19DRAFT_1250567 [Mycena capillaripes]|nr:hypothetical protein B0H19DRAFT_1250567 [Mycena capillaripes]
MAQKTADQVASRTRKASNRLLDGANGEEPDATHVSLIKAMHAPRLVNTPHNIKEAMLTKMWIKAGFLKRATLDCGRG